VNFFERKPSFVSLRLNVATPLWSAWTKNNVTPLWSTLTIRKEGCEDFLKKIRFWDAYMWIRATNNIKG
jgi:hypothetical protein